MGEHCDSVASRRLLDFDSRLMLNRPGFDAHFLSREGGSHRDKEVRRGVQGLCVGPHCRSGPSLADTETLRRWVNQAQVDSVQRDGIPTDTVGELRELKRKNRELEECIEILKAATRFFPRESDPRRR